MELLEKLGFITIGSLSIVGLIGFLCKNLFVKFLDARIETYKSELEKELEIHRHQLDKEAFKFQTKFSALHLERAQLIRELHKKLSCFYKKLSMVFLHANTLPVPEFNNEMEVKLLQELRDSYVELSEYFEENRIMFSKETSLKLNDLTKSYWNHEFTYQKLRTFEQMQELDKSEKLKNETEKRYKELYDIYYSEIPSILKEIEDEFRKLLGVEKN